ncbi:MAG: N-acetyltransferase [Rubrobacter sp.]|nr:N-acetyltransferase [Rubrobacter sp.]
MRIDRFSSISQVDAAEWRTIEPPDFPFFDYEFLLALENSRSVGRRSGWSPVYLVCEDGGRVVGALPLYLKSDSYGEYVFDWAWANAYHEHGMPYYPKLVSAVPFTPATGPKLLVRSGVDRERVAGALLGAAEKVADESGASSSHALFLPERELDAFEERGFAIRHSLQFHWHNRGYDAFSDYLDAMTSKRRRQVARERRQLEGVEIERLTGDDLRPEHAALMYGFYVDTYDRKWGSPYLTRGFFDQVFHTMGDRIMLVISRDELTRRPVAGSLFFYKGNSLFGRYWGAVEDVRNLHFELCYYQGIEFAVEGGMSLFEAGAQGEHKLARGFLPAVMYSAHDIRHPAFRRAIEQYIADERAMISYELDEYMSHDPFK